MSYNKPTRLIVANRRDFVLWVGLLMLLAVLSALLSSQPVLLIVLTILIFVTGWGISTLDFSKVTAAKLTLVIFADGRVSLESTNGDTIEGFLDAQQWCTHRVAVLRVAIEGTTRRLVIVSAQQQNADDFRRLNMWLRQDFCSDTRDKQVSGI
ncbi:hypothetical protein ACFL3I_03180 [Pseudomonadota bacterium]